MASLLRTGRDDNPAQRRCGPNPLAPFPAREGGNWNPPPSLASVSIFSKRADGTENGKPETENKKQKTGQFGPVYISGFLFSVFHSFAGWLSKGAVALYRQSLAGRGDRSAEAPP